jgi:preprotein translocase subunit SecD
MRNLAWKIIFIIALLALCLWAVYPPKDRVRLGKDLRGGVSLVYHVNIDPRDPNPQATVTQVITVLKERVNPKGVLDISMQPLGFDRIEIVMPLPSKTVRALREAYEGTLEALLRDAQISAGELQMALEAGQVVQRFGGERPSRRARRSSASAARPERAGTWSRLSRLRTMRSRRRLTRWRRPRSPG